MASARGRLGFDVSNVRDADRAGMNEALRLFARDSAGGDVAVVFYAGHGLEVDGVHYLVPVDARLERDTDVEYEALALDRVLLATAGASLRVVTPGRVPKQPAGAFDAADGGVAQRHPGQPRGAGRGSAGGRDPGGVCGGGGYDGGGRDGTEQPVHGGALDVSGAGPLEIGILFREVRARVLESTGGELRPHEYASLLGELPGRRIGSGHGDGGRQRVESCAGAAGNGGTCRSATVNLNCALRAKNNDVAGAQVCSGQLADWMVAEADDSRVGGAALAAWVGNSCWACAPAFWLRPSCERRGRPRVQVF